MVENRTAGSVVRPSDFIDERKTRKEVSFSGSLNLKLKTVYLSNHSVIKSNRLTSLDLFSRKCVVTPSLTVFSVSYHNNAHAMEKLIGGLLS